jgi:hypothetical protein
LCGEENYRRVRRTFAERRCRDKATETRNSNPQGEAVGYGGKNKGDGEGNARIGE